MVGDHQDIGVVVQQLQQIADFLVDIRVIIADEGLERVAGNVLAVQRIVVFPEAVMDAVDADFDELEIVPVHGGHQVADDLEMLPGHVINLIAEPVFVFGAEAPARLPDIRLPAVRFPV